jgi:glycosyltransferase involved in cell wall biosynthesis
VYDLARGLVDHVEEVHALVPDAAELPRDEVWEGVRVHRFRYFLPRRAQTLCYRHGIPANLRANPLLLAVVPFFVLAQTIAILRYLRRHEIAVVNSHWIIFQGLAAALARTVMPFRHVLQVHAAGLYLLLRLPRWLGRSTARFIVKRSDHVICVSSYVLDRTTDLLGFAPPSASVACMGVDTALFGKTGPGDEPADPRILFVGRLVEKKGVEYLLRAFPRVREEIPPVRLDIVGTGEREAGLKSLAAELGLAPEVVTFHGSQPHERVVELLRESRVVTVPSVVDAHGETEGMPTVILEAMAAGKRVVASRVNGTPDLVKPGHNGWLCPPADPERLARALVEALNDGHDGVPDAARKTAAHHDWARVCARYAEVLLGRPGDTC